MPGKSHSILLKATSGSFSHAFRFRPTSPVQEKGPEDLRSDRCRNGNSLKLKGNCVRRFVIPTVNFGAADYVDLIDWQALYVTPLTVLRHIGSHELLKMIQDDVPMDGWDFINFFHTRKQLSEL
ncbi:hypothetical protein AVEN_111171-1 [Araneus ventricosus]|uniref:Uncharacterized protein n=1 Tax=Araneus ventricosus TaxID=182803 RepID=A0A4Y2L8G5_ARAVE|nr:hypothetical protein AVEN_111171-1 [Araneus ventricosus]